jgi:hypothetical protein
MRPTFLLATGCLALAALIGCSGSPQGPPTSDVTVTVTYGGAPVTAGRVDLTSKRPGSGAGGELNSDGVATIPGVAPGEYVVIVVPALAVQVPGAAAEKTADDSQIPAKVRTPETSPLKADIKQGTVKLQFDLKEIM